MHMGFLLKIPCFASQNAHVVDKALNELLVTVRLSTASSAALVDENGGVELNLEFVLLFHSLCALEIVSTVCWG